jgi:ArsR family transcriptional regulator
MHYRIIRPKGQVAASILDAALDSLKLDRQMKADLSRLTRACCEPQHYVTLQGAPVPTRLEAGPP